MHVEIELAVTPTKRQIGNPRATPPYPMETVMRDAFDLFEFADHGRQWTATVAGLFHRLHAGMHWAGAAFTTPGLRRAG